MALLMAFSYIYWLESKYKKHFKVWGKKSQLVFPTAFGNYSFYTIVTLGSELLKSVEIIENKDNNLKKIESNILVVKNIQNDQDFSIDQINIYFKSEITMINNVIDKFFMTKKQKIKKD